MTSSYDSDRDPMATLLRLIAWGTIFVAFAFLLENWLMHWRGFDGARSVLSGGSGWLAALGYVAAVAATLFMVFGPRRGTLTHDADRITTLVAYLARAAFWLAFLIGSVDALISFLRVENMLEPLVGEQMSINLGLSQWRGPYVHMPLAALALVLGAVTRGISFVWLALWVVVVQLSVVFGRFIFSYEQTFISDLVRFWYAAMFLFASAFTLVEDGHVRVDVFYGSMGPRARAMVNGVGSILFGMTMMWIILILGTVSRSSTITGPFVSYEMDQQTYGMMTKYWMAAFLGMFAIMMLFQFAAMLLKSGAEWRASKSTMAAAE